MTTAGANVYVNGSHGVGGTVLAVNGSTGEVLWTAQDPSGPSNTALAVTSDAVCLSTGCSWTFAYARGTGKPLWSYVNDNCLGGLDGTPAYHNGRLYIRHGVPTNEIFDGKTGQQIAPFAADPMPAFDGKEGFFLNGSTLTAQTVNTRQMLWSVTGDGTLSTAPFVVDHVVYEGTGSGYLYALNETTGAVLDKAAVGASVPAPNDDGNFILSGMVAGQGIIVVPTGSGIVALAGTQP